VTAVTPSDPDRERTHRCARDPVRHRARGRPALLLAEDARRKRRWETPTPSRRYAAGRANLCRSRAAPLIPPGSRRSTLCRPPGCGIPGVSSRQTPVIAR